jgi:hypothetical protein
MNGLRQIVAGCTVVALFAFAAATPADAGLFCHKKASCCETACAPACEPVCCEPVCCPAPPVQVCWTVSDPCNCCTYDVSACVPAECAEAVPTQVGWSRGWFGRKVLTFKFEGCDHCVDVVITKHGRTIVRD